MSKFMSVYNPKYYHDINFFIYIFFGIKSKLNKERKAKQEKLKYTIMKRRSSLGAEVSVSYICSSHFYLPHSIGSKDFLCIRNKSQSSTACLLL